MNMSRCAPSPTHAPSDTVFVIGENSIVCIEERTTNASNCREMSYLVQFKDAAPTEDLVAETVDMMKVFKDISWDFELLADMRSARLVSQLRHASAYSQLIGLIENPHCKHCYVYVNPLPPVVGPLLTTTVERIVSSLSVPCTIVHGNETSCA